MMVLDTNVVSELMRTAPAEAVIRWLADQPGSSLYTTTITQAEVLFGVALLPEGRRRDSLLAAAEQMFEVDFAGKLLAFDSAAARAFAAVASDRRRMGRPAGTLDVQVAAIAQSRGAGVVTRNVSHFEGVGIAVIDPWSVEK
jgi:toxin FitB